MGSFYSTFSITDASIIDGDATYMQLILPTWVRNPHSIDGEKIGCGEKGLRVSNEGALGEFVPFGFPILGRYADYGDIDDIERDRNVEMLEKFFNLSIENIIDCATDDRWFRHGMDEDRDSDSMDWSIGNNKMEHIEILKQLTVTYFKKEHYDFLASDFHGDDSWWMDESRKRLDKMKEGLKRLGEHWSSNPDKPKLISKEDITDEQVTHYRKIFADNGEKDESDDEVRNWLVMMANSIATKGPFADLTYTFPITSMATTDMYKILPLGVEDFDNVKKQYQFIINMHSLYKVLRPSYYGSQSSNKVLYTRFHKFSTELISEESIKEVQNDLAYHIEDILENVEGVDDKSKELMHNAIVEGLLKKGIEIG